MASGDTTVIRKTTLTRLSIAVLCIAGAAAANVAQAFDMGNIMNPSRWFGGDHDRYYDRGYYGYGGPYGGYGPWGYGGYGGPYGPWGGGYPGYGWGGYPGYGGYGGGYPSTIVVNPTAGSSNEAPTPPPRLPE
jgi:hypothetical protein